MRYSKPRAERVQVIAQLADVVSLIKVEEPTEPEFD